MRAMTFTIGRGESDAIRVSDEYASTPHARITVYENRRVTVEDCGSLNGTFVDGERVYGPVEVGPLAIVRVGRTNVQVLQMLHTMANLIT